MSRFYSTSQQSYQNKANWIYQNKEEFLCNPLRSPSFRPNPRKDGQDLGFNRSSGAKPPTHQNLNWQPQTEPSFGQIKRFYFLLRLFEREGRAAFFEAVFPRPPVLLPLGRGSSVVKFMRDRDSWNTVRNGANLGEEQGMDISANKARPSFT